MSDMASSSPVRKSRRDSLLDVLRNLGRQVHELSGSSFDGACLAAEDAVRRCCECPSVDTDSVFDPEAFVMRMHDFVNDLRPRFDTAKLLIDDALRLVLDHADAFPREPCDPHEPSAPLEACEPESIDVSGVSASSRPPHDREIRASFIRLRAALVVVFHSLVDVACSIPRSARTSDLEAVDLHALVKDDVAWLETLTSAFATLHGVLCDAIASAARGFDTCVDMCREFRAWQKTSDASEISGVVEKQIIRIAEDGAAMALELVLTPCFTKTSFAQKNATVFHMFFKRSALWALRRILDEWPRGNHVADALTNHLFSRPWKVKSDMEAFVVWLVSPAVCNKAKLSNAWVCRLMLHALEVHALRVVESINEHHGLGKDTDELISRVCRRLSSNGPALIERLVSWGCDPSALHNRALRVAVQQCNTACVDVLLRDDRVNPNVECHPLDANVYSKFGLPLFEAAAFLNCPELAVRLLRDPRVAARVARDSMSYGNALHLLPMERAVMIAHCNGWQPLYDVLMASPHAPVRLFEDPIDILTRALWCTTTPGLIRLLVNTQTFLARIELAGLEQRFTDTVFLASASRDTDVVQMVERVVGSSACVAILSRCKFRDMLRNAKWSRELVMISKAFADAELALQFQESAQRGEHLRCDPANTADATDPLSTKSELGKRNRIDE
jgi:hypothetical protein